jgi:hypothetical protein
MDGKLLQKLTFYSAVMRLWCFLVLSMVIIVVMFPIRLPLCGTGGNAEGSKLSFRNFEILLSANAVVAAVIVRLRSWLLLLLATIVGFVFANWVMAHLFSMPLNF